MAAAWNASNGRPTVPEIALYTGVTWKRNSPHLWRSTQVAEGDGLLNR